MIHPAEKLTLLAAGELPEEEAREVRAHLQGCAECRSRYQDLRALSGSLGAIARSEATFDDLLTRRARKEECGRLAEALTGHAYEGGDPEVALHVERCACCRERLEETRRLLGALDRLGETAIPFRALRARMDRARRRRRAAGVAAAFLLAAGAAWLLRGGGTPPDLRPPVARAKGMEALIASLESSDDEALKAAAAKIDRQNLLDCLELASVLERTRDTLHAFAAVRLLRHLETPGAQDLLERALGREPGRDAFILRALAELGSRKAAAALVRRLEDPGTRGEALDLLARLGDEGAIGPVARLLPEERAAEVLAGLPEKALIEAARRHPDAARFVAVPSAALHRDLAARAARDAPFRAAALQAAPAAGRAGAEFLLRLSSDGREALRGCGPDAAARALRRGLEDPELARPALAAVEELGLGALAPDLKRAVLRGRLGVEEALPVVLRLEGGGALAFILKLLGDGRTAVAAEAALERVSPELRKRALGAPSRPVERREMGVAAIAGRFRR
jgi:hypothetical protein